MYCRHVTIVVRVVTCLELPAFRMLAYMRFHVALRTVRIRAGLVCCCVCFREAPVAHPVATRQKGYQSHLLVGRGRIVRVATHRADPPLRLLGDHAVVPHRRHRSAQEAREQRVLGVAVLVRVGFALLHLLEGQRAPVGGLHQLGHVSAQGFESVASTVQQPGAEHQDALGVLLGRCICEALGAESATQVGMCLVSAQPLEPRRVARRAFERRNVCAEEALLEGLAET
eukprot:6170318-Prymnesium_polylepis.1